MELVLFVGTGQFSEMFTQVMFLRENENNFMGE